MGRLIKLRNRTLRGQIVTSFHITLVCSIVATLIIWGLIIGTIIVLINTGKINPANHFESKIPELLTIIYEKGDILHISNQEILEEIIPIEGLDYQIVNHEGTIMYGSMHEEYLSSAKDLAIHLNNNLYDGQQIIQYYPIFDEQEHMNGAIGFRYQLSLVSTNPKVSLLFILISVIAFISPFVFFYLFSFLIGKRMSSTIEQPFNEIIASAHKIQNHDLNFSLSHINSTVELNHLVTAFEEMKEALKESLNKQWELEEERKEMVAAIAHDLKTPLTIILGHIEGLMEMENPPPERIDRYLKTIQSSCNRSIQLIKELNEATKIEQVEFKLNFSRTHIADWIQLKADEYKVLCESNNITFQATIMKQEKEYAWLDVSRINQVLDNVFTNSINYIGDRGEIQWLSTITEEEIIFEILDNGPGFSSKNKTDVFKKFYREDHSRRSSTGHSGLGLFIAKTIAEKHGGTMIAENRVEGGAYVKIIIKNMKE